DELWAARSEGPPRQYSRRGPGRGVETPRNPACRQIFPEFNAIDTDSLADVLRAHGETAEVHLRRMRFRDGSHHLRCIRQEAYAVTRTGSLDVFVCGSFLTEARRDPSAAANVLIHEELHSLRAREAPVPWLPSCP